MATVLNRTTKQLILSANTPDYPIGEWIIEPNLSAVTGFASKYWIITGDVVTLMTQGQRDTVDAAELAAARDAVADQIDQLEGYVRGSLLAILDEFNLHATRLVALLNAIDNNATLATIKTAVLAINDIPQRTVEQMKTAIRGKLGT